MTDQSGESRQPLPPRFVVIVWMHDHWGVTYSTDDRTAANKVQGVASTKVPCALVVDTMDAEGLGIGPSDEARTYPECEDCTNGVLHRH